MAQIFYFLDTEEKDDSFLLFLVKTHFLFNLFSNLGSRISMKGEECTVLH